MTLNDAHCHFFSHAFFGALASQRGRGEDGADLCREIGWEAPETPEALASRWVRELDAHGVSRAVLIASVPGDESSVAAAVAHAPARVIGYFMVDPSAPDAVVRVQRALGEQRLRGVCLFPAMSRVPLDDPRTEAVIAAAAAVPGTVVFIHCGVLSVGVRGRLGLPSPFDQRLGDPLGVARLASRFGSVPFVIPHLGAGLFRETLMALDVAANVHVDTSSTNRWIRYTPGLSLEAAFRAAFEVAGPSRILFGTDSSFFPRGWHQAVLDAQLAVLERLGVAPADRALVLGGNLDRLLPPPARSA